MSPRDFLPKRLPEPVRPPRMAQLSSLPLFFKLAGRRAIVIGGDDAAAWKAELLAAAGARVEVWDTEPGDELQVLAAEAPDGALRLVREPWENADLPGASVIVAVARDNEEARRIFAAAANAGIPVNVVDRPTYCTFNFGAVVNRSPLVVGISTDGAAPIFAQAIRSRIEALLPGGFAHWVQAAKAWRRVMPSTPGHRARRRFWELFATRALREPNRRLEPSDLEALLGEAGRVGRTPQTAGHVTLVGAGPGDPELLTLAALRALRSADVILYDDLVAREILDFARREAKRMLVGKTGRKPSCRQDDINALMIGLATQGRHVVRLKAGDPSIFGRAGEEIAALEQADITVDIVPGVTAAQGAAARLGISLTDRGSARRVQFVTGHSREGQLPDDLDLSALADSKATTAIYMPLGTLEALRGRLLAAGVEPGRPACGVFNATRADERIVDGTLATIAGRIRAANASGPCILILGHVLRARSQHTHDQRMPCAEASSFDAKVSLPSRG
jgi:uroporphyrin-III C-methyltransferase / precorrin-2 dehydrogenase / sirohydrochlorin ferrochelatase